jgi:hypothetical protein
MPAALHDGRLVFQGERVTTQECKADVLHRHDKLRYKVLIVLVVIQSRPPMLPNANVPGNQSTWV